MRIARTLLVAAVGLGACGGAGQGGAEGDARSPDSAADARVADAQVRDAALADALVVDAAPPDAVPPDAAPPDAAACPPGSAPTAGRCVDPLPWPAGSGPRVDDALCISAEPPAADGDAGEMQRTSFFDRVTDMGIHALRFDFRWVEVERTRGTFDFAPSDRQVDAARARGIEVIGLLGYGNPWASAAGMEHNDPYYPPDDPEDFATYAAAVAAHYRGRVHRWEVWNEQNAGYRFWKGTGTVSGDPAAYGALLIATARAIRAADPDAIVSFGGLFYLPQLLIGAEDFTEATYAAHPDVGSAFDTLSYHPYSAYPPNKPPEFEGRNLGAMQYPVDETARRMRALIQRHEGHAKPLWVTEVGWPTRDLDPLDQARYTIRATLLLLTEQVEYVCTYTFSDGDPARQYLAPWEQFFGLYTWEGQAKPAVDAYRILHSTLGGLRFAVDLGARYGEAAHHLGFTDDAGRRVHVLWTQDGEQDVRFPASAGLTPAGFLGVCDDGCRDAVRMGADGVATVRVGPSPLYLVEGP